jgi:hypothetical protein
MGHIKPRFNTFLRPLLFKTEYFWSLMLPQRYASVLL